uniref:Uncharacterized protein n=1 Tax=Setaria italica TaxID=4555 RepID=K4ANA8_SETIT
MIVRFRDLEIMVSWIAAATRGLQATRTGGILRRKIA